MVLLVFFLFSFLLLGTSEVPPKSSVSSKPRTNIIRIALLTMPWDLRTANKITSEVCPKAKSLCPRIQILTPFSGSPTGLMKSFAITFTRTHHLPPITMAECRCYYRADGRSTPPKVGPGALRGPIGITWCDWMWTTSSRSLVWCFSYNYDRYYVKTQQRTGPLMQLTVLGPNPLDYDGENKYYWWYNNYGWVGWHALHVVLSMRIPSDSLRCVTWK